MEAEERRAPIVEDSLQLAPLTRAGVAQDDPRRRLYGTAVVLEQLGNVIARGGD